MIDTLKSLTDRRPLIALAVLVALATLLRVGILLATPLNLGPDEAQYWSWSLTPALGYFSKPPLIAWLIAGSTSVCGDGEACIRISAPLLHAGTTFLIFFAARALYDQRIGFWSALTYLCIPGTSFSSLLITTDVPLLFFWTLALWALAEQRRNPSLRWAVTLGAAIGLGLLSKYAMLYFVMGAAIAFLPIQSGRNVVFSRHMAVTALTALAIFSPNLAWNLTNSFATVRHTASNANWGAAHLFNVGHIFEFLAAQIGIIGPVAGITICWGLVRRWRAPEYAHPDTLLMALSLPVIAVVATQAFISRANANWAAPAFIALVILACAWTIRQANTRVLISNTVINVSIGIFLGLLAVSPAFVAAIDQENSVKRLRGWDEAGQTIVTMSSSGGFTSILSDDREDMASLFYYTRARHLPLRMWPKQEPANEYEASYALTASVASRVLFVTRRADASDITNAFASAERIGTVQTRLDSKRNRTFYLFALSAPVTASTFPEFLNRPSTD